MKKRFAPLWKRVVAYIIDIFVVSFLVVTPFSGFFDADVESFADLFAFNFSSEVILVGVAIAILTLFYWTFLEWRYQQTVGKILLRIRVKGNITLWQAITRNVTKLSTLVLILDVLYMFYTKNHQRYFEKLSRTEVVDEIRKKGGLF